ncbi:hypothetical protein F0U44_02735 [Nocardioides humilatus]|uniref:Sensor domain-containing protein n=1 Tax=Nocardioides humilatus TaxID=2607660 RepID=A0A5B1LKG6_9ACTN|nr:hypothetical protein [Nocardioides humilatus]KAA1421245.1 hypothetical protein F0U44_02735 [Nocardioides humilatus]
MLRLSPTAVTVLVLALTGCGGDGDDAGAAGSGSGTPSVTNAATPTSVEPTTSSVPSASISATDDPALMVLNQGELEAALLTITDMPPGYSQDPPKDRPIHYFCNYDPPVMPTATVRHDFTKGGGLSTELAVVRIEQLGNADEAARYYSALEDALGTCDGETYQDTALTYSPMSVEQTGDRAIGVKIEADDFTLFEVFILTGPAVLSVGVGGLVNTDANVLTGLVRRQVERYSSAASN